MNIQGSFRCEKKRCNAGEILDDEGYCIRLECGTGFEPGPSGSCIVSEFVKPETRHLEDCKSRTLMSAPWTSVSWGSSASTQWAASPVPPDARQGSASTQGIVSSKVRI